MAELKNMKTYLLKIRYDSYLLKVGRYLTAAIEGVGTHVITYYSYLLEVGKYITIAIDGVITPIILLILKLVFIDTSLRPLWKIRGLILLPFI